MLVSLVARGMVLQWLGRPCQPRFNTQTMKCFLVLFRLKKAVKTFSWRGRGSQSLLGNLPTYLSSVFAFLKGLLLQKGTASHTIQPNYTHNSL